MKSLKIATILDYIDNGHMVLPEFQRGYVWNRDQVRGLFDSLYRGYPIGGLLVWQTESKGVGYRGGEPLAAGMVDLLLDGQQRMTSIYGVVRGRPPAFFDGNANTFMGLYFHLEDENFIFYRPRMANDALWTEVSELMQHGVHGIGKYMARFSAIPELAPQVNKYVKRLLTLLSITEVHLHVDEVTGADKSLDVVVDIFNRVNSGGTKLSQGDLALAKICVDWPKARDLMKDRLKNWQEARFNFTLDWLLRSINTVLTGEARFTYLHDKSAEQIQNGLSRATKSIDSALNMIGGRLGLDHDRVLFGRFAIPVMARFLDQRNAPLDGRERDKLLFWYIQAGMWGRFSGSTETSIDQDLALLEGGAGDLDRLIEELGLWHGGDLWTEPAHFRGWSLGARFYPVLYMLTRMGEAKDWGTGLPLKAGMLGRHNTLEVHHIFPKAQFYKHGYRKVEVNALANFCFLTKYTNLTISDRLPAEYFPEIAAKHPGALASQWIPPDAALWNVDNYLEFLEARRVLLSKETNGRLAELLHGDGRWLQSFPTADTETPWVTPAVVVGGITSGEEEQVLETLNEWIAAQGLPRGMLAYDFADADTGEQRAVFDLAWPNGIQQELSQPWQFYSTRTPRSSFSPTMPVTGVSRTLRSSGNM